VHHLFLKPLSTGISEKNEWPLDRRAAHPRCSTPPPFEPRITLAVIVFPTVLTCPAEAKPNSRSYALGLRIIGKKLRTLPRRAADRSCYETHGHTKERAQCGQPGRNTPARILGDWLCLHAIYFKHSKMDISQNVKSLPRFLGAAPRETVPRRAVFFSYLATIFRRSGPPPDGLAVASLDSTSCGHGLPFITIQ